MAGSEAGNSRHYTIGGRKFVRVSTVLGIIDKPYLARWYGKHGNDECARLSKVATDFGKRFHECMERHLVGGGLLPWDVPADMVEHVRAACAWVDANVIEVVAVERRVHSERYQYAGTADLIARFRGVADEQPIPADWKTSKQIGWEYGLQLSAYLEASREMGDPLANGRLPLWVPREQPGVIVAEPLPADEHNEDFGAFLAARALYQVAEARRKREDAAWRAARRARKAS